MNAPNADGWDDAAADVYEEQYLYDLSVDPYELNNLIDYVSHKEVAAELRERLLERIEAAGESRPVIHPQKNIKIADSFQRQLNSHISRRRVANGR